MFRIVAITFTTCLVVITGCYSNLLQRAEIYEEMGDFGSAIHSYQKATETNNTYNKAKALGELGRLYVLFGTNEYYWKAETVLKEAKALLSPDAPEYPDVSFYLGYAYYALGPQWADDAASNFEEALKYKADHFLSHFYLGTLYYQVGAYKQALVHLNRVSGTHHDAYAKYIVGTIHRKLGEYSDANRHLVAAIQLESDDTRRRAYQQAINELAVEVERREAQSAKIGNVQIDPILAALYRSYDEVAIGSVTLRNPTTEPLYDSKLLINVPQYMDAPTVQTVGKLSPKTQTVVDLRVKFNDQIFDVTNNIENQPLSVVFEYVDAAGKKSERKDGIFFQIYNRNVTFWEPVESIVSFISPQNPAVQEITRTYSSADNPLEKAIQIYDALQLYGIEYQLDPNDPYGQEVDTVYYPWETLKFKKGDCDDLSVLYASCLHNVGVDTALLLPDDHIYVMFDSGIAAERAKRILPDPSLYTVVNETTWIPVEVTMLGRKDEQGKDRTFFDAWQEGARFYRANMDRIFTTSAWQDYKTASAGPAIELTLPDPMLVSHMYYDDLRRAEEHWLTVFSGKAQEYQERLQADVVVDEANLHNLLGVTYARMGEDALEKAENELQQAVLKAPSVSKYHSNLANVLLLQGRTEEAAVEYEKAIEWDAKNPFIYFNLAIYHFMLQETDAGLAAIDRAREMSSMDTVNTVARVMGLDPDQFGLPVAETESKTRAAGITEPEHPRWLLNWLE